MKPSTGLRNNMLSGSSVKAALDGGEIRIYAGVEPTSADDAIGAATLLTTIKNGAAGLTFAAAVAGVMLKAPAEVWSGINSAGGTASFYRFVTPGDAGAASAALSRVQGSVGVASADMNLSSVVLAAGATQGLNFYSLDIPA